MGYFGQPPGGTSGNTSRCTSPASSIARRFDVSTFCDILPTERCSSLKRIVPFSVRSRKMSTCHLLPMSESVVSTGQAADLLAVGYIQHDLAFGTGRDAFVVAVEGLAAAPAKTTVRNVRAYQDGDKVFLHTVYDFAGAGEQVAFDVFRFDADGKIAEHWDVIEPLAERGTWQNGNGKF